MINLCGFKFIMYQGYIYFYDYRVAKNREDMCLATKDPTQYCNGVFLYSDKDPGSGMEFVIVATDNPDMV